MYRHVLLFAFTAHLVNAAYVIPPATVEVLSPMGLKVSIPDSPGITLFAFHGNINEPFRGLEAGQMARDIIIKRGDRWVFEDKNVRLKQGDTLYYWLYVILDGLGYNGLGRNYTVRDVQQAGDNTVESCFNSPTRVNGQVQCSGKIIFEKYFSGQILDKNTWSYEIQIGGNDLVDEFVVFNNDPLNNFLFNNNLVIKPRLLESVYDENFIKIGQLFLNGVGFGIALSNLVLEIKDYLLRGDGCLVLHIKLCTSNNRNYCEKRAQTYLILPPVLSARLTTKNSFSFLYGTVEIKAKFPEGDWIVPELWLQPKESTQNSRPAKIILGLARGNKQLSCQGKDMSNRLLLAGTMYGDSTRMVEKFRSTEWSKDFHVYKVIWNPNGLIFTVDNEEIGRIDDTDNSLSSKECYITIGLHVGGAADFSDKCLSGDHEKPWLNSKPNRLLTFWQDKNSWFPTWNDDSGLRIEYIKVWAF